VKAVLDHPVFFLPDREAPYVLKHVYERIVDGCRQDMIFDFGDSHLFVHVDEDTDSFVVDFVDSVFFPEAACSKIDSTAPWHRWLGKECGWTWTAHNSQGYLDSFMMSFDGVVPNVLIYAIASSAEVYLITPLETLAELAARRGK